MFSTCSLGVSPNLRTLFFDKQTRFELLDGTGCKTKKKELAISLKSFCAENGGKSIKI